MIALIMDFYQCHEIYLAQMRNFEEVAAADFYRDIFPVGSFEDEVGKKEIYEHTGKGNAFLVYEAEDGKKHTRMIFDDLAEIYKYQDNKCCFMSCIAYFGRNRTLANARQLFAMVFDLDNVSSECTELLFSWKIDRNIIPSPTYTVNSGDGLHLYYVFDEPIPLYPNIQRQLKELKYALTDIIWDEDTSELDDRQYQGINQGFRIVGGRTKKGNTVQAYRTGKKISLAELCEYVEPQYRIKDTFYHPRMTLAEAKKKYPEWYKQRIEDGKPRGSWNCKRDLYDWWLKKADKVKFHHRYFYVMSLAIYAIKCGIPFDELKQDAFALCEPLSRIEKNNPFTREDVKSALEMYQPCFKTFPRDEISKLSAIPIQKNKRNGRKQTVHLKIARTTQKILDEENGTDWRENNGRKSVQEEVFDVLDRNPKIKAIEFCEKTGMSRAVFFKYKKVWKATEKYRRSINELKKYAIPMIVFDTDKNGEIKDSPRSRRSLEILLSLSEKAKN